MKMRAFISLLAASVINSAIINNTVGALPVPGFEIDPERTALVVTDPQNDFLSPEGVTWGVVLIKTEAQ